MIADALAGGLLGGLSGYLRAPEGQEWRGAKLGALGGALEGLGAPAWAINASLDAVDHQQPGRVISDVIDGLAAYGDHEPVPRKDWLDIWTDAAGSKQRQPGIDIYRAAMNLVSGNE